MRGLNMFHLVFTALGCTAVLNDMAGTQLLGFSLLDLLIG